MERVFLVLLRVLAVPVEALLVEQVMRMEARGQITLAVAVVALAVMEQPVALVVAVL